jgi:hypothetical protein
MGGGWVASGMSGASGGFSHDGGSAGASSLLPFLSFNLVTDCSSPFLPSLLVLFPFYLSPFFLFPALARLFYSTLLPSGPSNTSRLASPSRGSSSWSGGGGGGGSGPGFGSTSFAAWASVEAGLVCSLPFLHPS